MRNKLPTSVGVEYTYIMPDDVGLGRPWSTCPRNETLTNYAQMMRDRGFRRAHDDGGACEVPSLKHTTWKSMKSFHKRMMKAAKHLQLVTHKEIVEPCGDINVVAGGGGHVHVGLGRMSKARKSKIVFNMIHDVANRPFLNWIFNQFSDEGTADSIAFSPLNHEAVKNRDLQNYDCWKTTAIEYRKEFNSMEFRFFEMGRTWQDTEAYVTFALAYYKWICARTRKGEVIQMKIKTKKQVRSFTKRRCKREFEALLRQLKLPVKTYRKYYSNLDDRYAFGELR